MLACMEAITRPQQLALDWIFRAEGGLVNDPNDPGGITNHGISLRYLKKQGLAIGDIDGDGDIDADDIIKMDRDTAASIYLTDFWEKCWCNSLPSAVAMAVFDCAVNCGQHTAIKLLQEVCRVKIDGIIGPVTLTAAFKKDVVIYYMAKRAEYYRDITLANSTLSKYLRGWFNRLFHLQSYIAKGFIY